MKYKKFYIVVQPSETNLFKLIISLAKGSGYLPQYDICQESAKFLIFDPNKKFVHISSCVSSTHGEVERFRPWEAVGLLDFVFAIQEALENPKEERPILTSFTFVSRFGFSTYEINAESPEDIKGCWKVVKEKMAELGFN